jgi:hypothetical protein
MPSLKPPQTKTVVGALLLILTLYLWGGILGTLVWPDGAVSPSAHGFLEIYGIGLLCGLWAALGILLWLASRTREIPRWVAAPGLLLHPLSCAAAVGSVYLVSDPGGAVRWPVIVPALAPLCIVLFVIWASFPKLRALVPANIAGPAAWGALLILTLLPLPGLIDRERQIHSRAAAETAAQSEQVHRLDLERQERLRELQEESSGWNSLGLEELR